MSRATPANSAPTRRDALKAGAGLLAAPLFVPAAALGRDGATPPSERVTVGIIGTGGRARAIAKASFGIPEVQIAAICDCFEPVALSFAKAYGGDRNWNIYEDFRSMIEKESLDGVMVETTTHARAWIACQAMQMGMDAYIEKPMSLTISEGRHMVRTARKYDRVTQVGTQQRSMPLNNWASDLVRDGAIGKVRVVLAPNFVGPDHWPGEKEQPLPQSGSENWWDVWTNQCEMRPYHSALHHGWNRWWAYDGGGRCYGVTGWGTHSYDQIQRALGTDETGPVAIMLEEPVRSMKCGKFETIEEDATHLDYLHRLAKPVEGPRAKVRMWYANGTELRLQLDGDWGPGLGAIFVGEDGKIEINRDKVASNPKELVASDDNPGSLKVPETQPHVQNWVDCIKSRERCTADIEYGQRSSTLCYLVNIVRELGRVGEKLTWNPDVEKFADSDEANQSSYMVRPRRAGYELPKLS